MLKVVHPAMQRMLNEMAPVMAVSLHLFSNDYLATRNSVLGDFVECDFSGYADQAPAWDPAIQNGVEDVALAPALTFTAGAGITPQSVYGYFVLDDNGDLGWGETFEGGPTVMASEGQELKIFPKLKMKNYGE